MTAVTLMWTLRQAWAVHKLHRGVGRYLVPCRRRPAVVPDGRAPPGRAARGHPAQPAACVRRRSRTTGSSITSGSIRSRSAARWSAISARLAAVEGGSTLTQQLARTLFLSNKKSYGRKIREAALALMIDADLSKQQILELYLNRIYLSAGVYGVETMSRHLFRRPAKTLNLAECALIAGLARVAGRRYRPGPICPVRSSAATSCSPACAQEGFITEAQEREARATRIRIAPYPGPDGSARRLREGVPAAAVPGGVRRRSSARLGGAHELSSRPAGRGRARGV